MVIVVIYVYLHGRQVIMVFVVIYGYLNGYRQLFIRL